jgi:VanZ family protein
MPTSQIKKIIFIALKFWLPVLFCMGLIFSASSLPGNNIPKLFRFQSIIFHLSAYLTLAYFFARALKNSYCDIKLSQIIFFTLLFGVIYGISDELHQAFIPYRTVSVFDVFIDGVGSFIGSLIQPVRKKILTG